MNLRYFIEIAYDGTNYHGWQEQPNAITIQSELNNALRLLLRQKIKTTASSRTDAGVHCRKQFIHFDFPKIIDTSKICYKLNSLLSKDISTRNIYLMSNDSHARFDVLNRTYRYFITTYKDPFLYRYVYFFYKKLNINNMNRAAQLLLNYKKFKSFSKLHTDVKTFLCDIKEAYWMKQKDKLIFTITADRFLRGMVRMIAGALVSVGSKKMTQHKLIQIIESERHHHNINLLPACGLCLYNVEYPTKYFID